MKFCDRLNLYIETLGCSAKTLSAVSGLSLITHLTLPTNREV